MSTPYFPKSSSLFPMCVTRLALKHSYVHRKRGRVSHDYGEPFKRGAGVGKFLGKGLNEVKYSHQSPHERGNKVQGEGASEASSSTYASKVSMTMR